MQFAKPVPPHPGPLPWGEGEPLAVLENDDPVRVCLPNSKQTGIDQPRFLELSLEY